MGWADKIHKQRRAEKLAKELMSTEVYQEMKYRDAEQTTLDAFCMCCLITCEYLEGNFHCKHNGLEKFLEFARERKDNMDEDYFLERAEHHREVHDLEALSILGYEFNERE